jgi:hypothetical protein
MKYIDSIQEPLTLYGDFKLQGGQGYYCEKGKDNVRYNPTNLQIQNYEKRKATEADQANIILDLPAKIDEGERSPSRESSDGTSGFSDEDLAQASEETRAYQTHAVGTHITFGGKKIAALFDHLK